LTAAISKQGVRGRRSAAFALALLGEQATSAAPELRTLLKSDNGDVVWNAAQALQFARSTEPESVAALIEILDHRDSGVRAISAQALGSFGKKADAALPVLLKMVQRGHDEQAQVEAVQAVQQIGVTEEIASSLARVELSSKPGLAAAIFDAVREFPDDAIRTLRAEPKLVCQADADVLVSILEDKDARCSDLRDALVNNSDLPPLVMAWAGEQNFLPVLRQRIAQADSYEQIFLRQCARACGEKPDRVVTISEKDAGDFLPASARGSGDVRRMGIHPLAHGDGYTRVLVTGRIILSDGRPPQTVKIYNTNDRMLLGKRLKNEAAIKYDPTTGRFVFFTVVFAAYSAGDSRREPGPFQTGPASVLIEAAGAKPLEVTFFDEMPEVLITLPTSK
jgi:hypothetical protein